MATERRNRLFQTIALAIPIVWIVRMMFTTDSAGVRYASAAALAFVIFIVGFKIMEYREKYPRA